MTIDDAIKRYTSNAFYEKTDGNLQGYLEFNQLSEWLKELKELKARANWIPVSERLPQDRDWYLGVFKEIDTGWVNPLPFICDYVGKETKSTTKDLWILRGFTDVENPSEYYTKLLECVAWQPLPEPYEAWFTSGKGTDE